LTPPGPEFAALRRELRARRAALTPGLRIAAAQQVAARLHALPGLPDSGYVAGYWAVGGELALHAWQVSLPASFVYCLPVLHDDGRLRFGPWRPGDPLATNRFGIPEPDVGPHALIEASALALAIVPLVGFDDHCHRLGMGGGWYDRTFAARRAAQSSTPLLVGVGYEIQRVDRLADQPWDVQLDAVCTETATYLRQNAPAR
jgi:5-formyltetrahydrofolate cyclo-ligase